MTGQRVINPKHLPTRLPVWGTAVVWLLLDRFAATGWLQGVVWTLVVIIWIVAVDTVWKQEYCDPRFVQDKP